MLGICVGEKAQCIDDEVRRKRVAIAEADRPALGPFVPFRTLDRSAEPGVLAQVVELGDVVPVLHAFPLQRIVAGPVIINESVLVVVSGNVDAQARVMVDGPGAAKRRMGFDDREGDA